MKGYLLLAAMLGVVAGVGDETQERKLALAREDRWTLLNQTVRSVGTIASARRVEGRAQEAAAFDSLASYAKSLSNEARTGGGPLNNEKFEAFRHKLDRWLAIDDSLSSYGVAHIDPSRDAVAGLPPLDD